ncbi:hypothetical protein DICVIV_12390 [Dictyocaulus viviparus]|uniref:Uncharacterized protein n=1 Tax=Dictyocaulus viviparus TaxID=29172 RepID=A0A0D8XH02_DICVI|nr:hypothetical protein DICVIV_12390 [Dictyocaulus viviparus]
MEKILACIKLNGLNLSKQQLMDQISPIYANIFYYSDISSMCEKICNTVRNCSKQNYLDQMISDHCEVMGPHTISCVAHASTNHFEETNSGKSSFRPNISSLGQHRKASESNDSQHLSHEGLTINNVIEQNISQETCTSFLADGCSHSCDSRLSGSQNKELTPSFQRSQTASDCYLPSEFQLSTGLIDIVELVPKHGSLKVIVVSILIFCFTFRFSLQSFYPFLCYC